MDISLRDAPIGPVDSEMQHMDKGMKGNDSDGIIGYTRSYPYRQGVDVAGRS